MTRRTNETTQVVRITSGRTRTASRERPAGLTEEERRLLLAELAEITAELDELKQRAAAIAARAAAPPSGRLAHPA